RSGEAAELVATSHIAELAREATQVVRPVAPLNASGAHRSLTGLRVHLDSPEQAQVAFKGMLEHFIRPNEWFQSMPGGADHNMHYRPFADRMPITDRTMRQGDYAKVQMGNIGIGDWVHTESMGVDAEKGWAAITVRPAPSQELDLAPEAITHFYDPVATNTMSVYRDGSDIVASIDVRNGHFNNGVHAHDGRGLRNAVVSTSLHAGAHKASWTFWTLEHINAGLHAAGVKPITGLGDAGRTAGAISFVPDPIRNVGRLVTGRPTIHNDDVAVGRALISTPW
ncbi:MAG: hypothetical protein H7123_08215, partial [Thermoleophilia bacterium]|nr:hypothetical protein [Thermoleophilia bacterium]